MNAPASSTAPGLPSLGLPSSVTAGTQRLQTRPLSRNASIVLAVVLLHVVFIWALQSGLLMRTAELIVPAEVLSQFIEPPVPKVEQAPPVLPKLVPPVKKAPAKAPVPAAPKALAIPKTSPAIQPASPPVSVAALEPAPAPAPLAPAAPVAAPPAPSVQMPSSDADYLQNPKPPYPPISRRLNEQGKTTVRVLIGADGLPQRAEILNSSGFDRLDQAAVATVMRWRFVPGKRGGVAEAMWFKVPINWVLE
jgi:protein TonB